MNAASGRRAAGDSGRDIDDDDDDDDHDHDHDEEERAHERQDDSDQGGGGGSFASALGGWATGLTGRRSAPYSRVDANEVDVEMGSPP